MSELNGQSQTIGELMQEGSSGWGEIAKWAGYLVYLGGIIYVVAHNVNLFSGRMAADFQIWAYVSVFVLALNAIVLPIGIHKKFAPGGQREWALLCYALDILVAAANAVVDGLAVTNQSIVGLLDFYSVYVVTATPIFFGLIVWGVIWLLDPAQKRRDTMAKIRAATQMRLEQKIAERALANDVAEQAIDQAADQIVRNTARAVTGVYEKVPVGGNGKGPKAPNP